MPISQHRPALTDVAGDVFRADCRSSSTLSSYLQFCDLGILRELRSVFVVSTFQATILQRKRNIKSLRCCSSFTGKPTSELTMQAANSTQKGQNKHTKCEANSVSDSPDVSTLLFPGGFKHWRVNVDVPPTGFSSKAQAVDSYVKILTEVLGNEKDAQMCLYQVCWESNFGFCCVLDEKSSQELSAVSGVLSVQPDEQFGSEDKKYGETTEISKTKLFITGLSFYTSEKTLRSAFEPFGELVEVKVIMDKISKRSKGYAFVEYASEEAATTALQEMNGKIINGWMIVVDRVKSKPRYKRGHLKSISVQERKLT